MDLEGVGQRTPHETQQERMGTKKKPLNEVSLERKQLCGKGPRGSGRQRAEYWPAVRPNNNEDRPHPWLIGSQPEKQGRDYSLFSVLIDHICSTAFHFGLLSTGKTLTNGSKFRGGCKQGEWTEAFAL